MLQLTQSNNAKRVKVTLFNFEQRRTSKLWKQNEIKYKDKTFRNSSEFTRYEVKTWKHTNDQSLTFLFSESYDSYLPYSGFYA